MIKKIDILGMKLDNYTVREAIRRVEVYLDNQELNSIENVSMQMLIQAEEDVSLKELINNLDLAVIAEKEILRVTKSDTMQRLRETEEFDFYYEFFKRVERNKKTIFLLGETQEDTECHKERLIEQFPKLSFVGEYALEHCEGNMDTVINDLNSLTPDVIVSVLPTPIQEHFFMEHKDKMCANIWYGMGDVNPTKRKKGVRSGVDSMLKCIRLRNSMVKYHKN